MTSIKNYLCIAFLLVGSIARAQSLQFYFQGNPVADGTTVTIEPETDEWGDTICATNPSSDPTGGLVLRNLTDADIQATASLSIHRGTMNPTYITWCMGGECVYLSGDSYDNKAFSVAADGMALTQLDATPQAVGEMTARIRVVAQQETATVYVRFLNPDPAQPLRFMRRSVIEEYTGTWCDNCPRGLVGMQRLQEDFGDRCIVIHAHVGAQDPMALSVYNDLLGTTGVPMASIDRGDFLNPYAGSGTRGVHHYGIDVDFDAELSQPTEAGLELQAAWDERQRDVVYTATTTFNVNRSDAPYRLIFLLMENGLTGTGKVWAQANAFSPEAGGARVTGYTDEDMAYWNAAPNYVTEMTYNHVPVNTKGAKDGIAGSIAAPIVSGQAQSYTDKVTTFNQSVIQNKANLYAVALLLNTETGRVVNAAQAGIQAYADAVRDVEAAGTVGADQPMYDLQGRRLYRRPRSGCYIQGGRTRVVAP